MIKLFEHVLLLFVIGLFSYKNSLIYMYTIFSFISIVIWFVSYFMMKKMKVSNKLEMDINMYVVGIAIVMVNFICNLEVVNIAFGFSYLFIYFIKQIKFLLKKETYATIRSSYLCDLYSTLYLAGLIMEICKYEL